MLCIGQGSVFLLSSKVTIIMVQVRQLDQEIYVLQLRREQRESVINMELSGKLFQLRISRSCKTKSSRQRLQKRCYNVNLYAILTIYLGFG